MENYNHYLLFAELLRYPGKGYASNAKNCLDMLVCDYPEVALEITPFVEYTQTHSQDEIEELFTKTFDVQPICYLDLGYVIFGEDYKRGAFLLHMQEEQLKANNDCGTDLSDNISNMLTLYTRTNDQALLNELAKKIIIPGLEKMISEFKQARVDLKMKVLKKLHKAIIQEELNHGNVYVNLFNALLHVFKKDFEHVSYEKVLDPVTDVHNHNAFFSKNSVSNAPKNFQINEVNNLVNNYNLD